MKFSARGNWGITVLPGLKLADTLLAYSKLGYNWANLEINESVSPVNGVPYSASNNHISNSFQWGFGLETLVWAEWSLRAEFTHAELSSFGALSAVKPSDNQFMLGVSYHFYQI